MDVSTFINTLAPELILTIGACAVLVVGVNRSTRSFGGPLSVVVTLAALAAAILVAPDQGHKHFPGLLVTPLVHYARLAGLVTGAVILLCNMHLPVAEERGEFFSMILFSLAGLLLTAPMLRAEETPPGEEKKTEEEKNRPQDSTEKHCRCNPEGVSSFQSF